MQVVPKTALYMDMDSKLNRFLREKPFQLFDYRGRYNGISVPGGENKMIR